MNSAYIISAYLQAPESENHYIFCGREFGLDNVVKQATIVRALYEGKSAGSDFWHHITSCIAHLFFESTKADPYIWMRISVFKYGEAAYNKYVLLYSDDCLVISDRSEYVIQNEIGKYFCLKEEYIRYPGQYLGGKLKDVVL